MRPFKFRAQAALDLRRREHDDALRRRATALAALAAADEAIASADGIIAAADEQRAALMQEAVEHRHLQWHQAWRTRCVEERLLLQARRAKHDEELQQATEHVSLTFRRVRSLERLREHAIAAWNRSALEEERKTMDALAGSRWFVQEGETR